MAPTTPHTDGQRERPVIVIGAGLAGLSSACVLAARGHRVHVVESNAWLGGKAAQLEQAGFRFDMGPTILTMPRVLRRIFDEAGRDINDYLTLHHLDPQWRCFFNDGSVLTLDQKVERMQARLSDFAGSEAATGYKQFIDYAAHLHDISERFFFWKSIGGLRDVFDLSGSFNASTLRDVMRMRMGRSVASTVRRYMPDTRVAQMLDHFIQYIGSSPYGSPAILCGIAHMQTSEGVWYPEGGTRAVPEALVTLGQELGVTYETNSHVTRIATDNGEVTGITLRDGLHRPARAVVSNMDSVRTFRDLLGRTTRSPMHRTRYEPACSGVVLYLGLNKRYPHLAHHNFVFGDDPETEFDWIYQRGEPAPDPSAYIAAPAATEPAVAPEGGEALYVLVHTPYLRPHHDWSKSGAFYQRYRDVIIDKLKRTAGLEDIEQRIVTEAALTPQDIHDRYHVFNGAIYGLASHGKFTGAFKPGNRRTELNGLYLAGGAAHPGPGMPMVMMSGWIAADSLDADQPTQPASGHQTATATATNHA
jgi:phytoene desaturase